MLNISFGEILVFAVIALIVLGPDKLPQTLKSAFSKYRKLKAQLSKIQTDLENELDLIELKALMQEELQKIKDNETQLKSQLLKMQQDIESFQDNTALSSHSKALFQIYQPVEQQITIPFIQPQSPSEFKRERQVA